MKNLILSFMILGTTAISAQSIERQVIAAGGNSFTNASFSADYTFGQTVVESFTAGSIILTQGFHQISPAAGGVDNLTIASNLAAYPNPTSSSVTLEWQNDVFTGSISVIDATGRQVWTGDFSNNFKVEVDLRLFTPGVYAFHITDANNNSKVIRIVRM